MTNEQTAVYLKSQLKQLEDIRDNLSSELKDHKVTEKNAFGFEITRIPELDYLNEYISDMQSHIDTLTGGK